MWYALYERIWYLLLGYKYIYWEINNFTRITYNKSNYEMTYMRIVIDIFKQIYEMLQLMQFFQVRYVLQ